MNIVFLHRKESVVLTAIDIINELGIQGLSTKELAKRQGISEGTLFKHFRSKNEIILSVLDHFAKYDKDIFESCTKKNLKPSEALLFVADSCASYYENYPAITAIPQLYEFLAHDDELGQKLNQILDFRAQSIKQIIEAAQASGELRQDVDSQILLHIIIGSFRNICFNWRMQQNNFSLRERVVLTLRTVLQAFSSNHE
ncbi:TetR/AcrR family transcriptional regulator [Dendrosporobacter sp. 1207_IL3150]|uniref:TetR/AcrR family transcriptional regulator n=1 Tax=Dendrosporobacter sp. 1207_IL3150 TaxID=3084054 RepID=UPI002FD89216